MSINAFVAAARGENDGLETVTNTVVNTVEDTVNDIDTVINTGANTVNLIDFILDQDRLHSHKSRRTDVYLDEDESEMLDQIRKRHKTTGQSVLRLALRFLYSNYDQEKAVLYRKHNYEARFLGRSNPNETATQSASLA